MYYTSSPRLVIHSLPSFEGLLGSKYVIWLRIWTLEVQQRTKIWQFLNHFCPLCTYSSTAAHHTYFTFTTKHQLVHIRAPWSKVLMTVQLEEQSDVWTMTLWAAWFVAERTCRSQKLSNDFLEIKKGRAGLYSRAQLLEIFFFV